MHRTLVSTLAASALALAVAGPLLAATPAHAAAPTGTDPIGPAGAEVAAYTDEFPTHGLVTAVLQGGEVAVTTVGIDGAGAPVTADTPFRIASMSKSFTAAVVLQLVEQGRLDLDDPLATALPGFAMADPRADGITIRMLLSHTSGISSATTDEYGIPPATSVDAILAALQEDPLAAAPGEASAYANTNYALLAGVVERIEGRPFDDVVRDRLLAPLGMTSTSATVGCADPSPGLATGHAEVPWGTVVMPEPPGTCLGSGGLVSTAADVARWVGFQMADGVTATGERLLSSDSVRALRAPTPASAGYGFGWQVDDVDGRTIVEHGGTLVTWGGAMAYVLGPDGAPTGTGAVVLANGPGAPMSLAHALLASADGVAAPEAATNPQPPIHLGFLVAAVIVLLLGVIGIARSGRWAARNARRRTRIVRAAWPLGVAVLGVLLPPILFTLLLGGRFSLATAWAYLPAMYPTFGAFAVALVAAGLAVFVARAVARRRRPAGHRSPASATLPG